MTIDSNTDIGELMLANEVADFLRTTTASLYNQLSRGNEGQTIPSSIQVGRKRMWLKSDVIAWLQAQKEKTQLRMDVNQTPRPADLNKPTIRRI
ncbi:helix-turn-helix transcriptional regulator [Planctobacterium marinum]|uniref:Helix-turn-helix domain-containing protein n=1 Tax=Planctobacterium marinum TaxID=1631968 RepID=A0AA48I2B7_9ALTE|nr:hypothetical protein MACH26_01410 [Planctobacterium marinum]